MAGLIRVIPQPEPADFDAKVRQPGKRHLATGGSSKDEKKNFWVRCLDDLYNSYGGVCAYLAIHFERVTGAASTDHFVPKNSSEDLAYEWSNYRLACRQLNSDKSTYQDVVDPFEIDNGWFRLEPVTGRIYPSPSLDPAVAQRVRTTIEHLGLDSPACRMVRVNHYQFLLDRHVSASWLRRHSPFVWVELQRQGLL